ncbi:MAG TPA: DUF2892 domain-containing protein [Clostridia bacterium]|nr:DUF2892 domain-containing protein [Clostridia bacterium]
MKRFFAPNISGKGRVVRGILGSGLIVAGLLVSGSEKWVCFALVASGGFVLYEAVRGWCVMRACGIKTKI